MPMVKVEKIREISITIEPSPKNCKIPFPFGPPMFKREVIANNKMGSKAVRKLVNDPGKFSLVKCLGRKVSRGLDFIWVKVLENKGPAMIIVGIAIISPYNKVLPMSA